MENCTVLIVDDDATTVSLLETLLQMENYPTATATAVPNKDIVALLEQKQPDMLVLDYHMHGRQTAEYLPIIRAHPTWQTLPVLMTSAIDRRQECLAAGADEFLLKPFNWQDVTRLVNKLRNNAT